MHSPVQWANAGAANELTGCQAQFTGWSSPAASVPLAALLLPSATCRPDVWGMSVCAF